MAGVERLIAASQERFEHIDILVHNAGIFPYNPLENMDDDAWNRVINVNLTSAYRLTKACIPAMKERGAGRVLFTSSVQGNYVAVPGCAHYAASKAGLTGLIKSAAMELALMNVIVMPIIFVCLLLVNSPIWWDWDLWLTLTAFTAIMVTCVGLLFTLNFNEKTKE